MFPIGNVDDFKIYRARDEDIESGTAMIARAEKANRNFLENEMENGCELKISGTFIYAHPPDYRGRPMLHASVAEWRSAFRRQLRRRRPVRFLPPYAKTPRRRRLSCRNRAAFPAVRFM